MSTLFPPLNGNGVFFSPIVKNFLRFRNKCYPSTNLEARTHAVTLLARVLPNTIAKSLTKRSQFTCENQNMNRKMAFLLKPKSCAQRNNAIWYANTQVDVNNCFGICRISSAHPSQDLNSRRHWNKAAVFITRP